MTDVGEGAAPTLPCPPPPHDWEVIDDGKDPDEQKKAKREEAQKWRDKDAARAKKAQAQGSTPSKDKYTNQARSADFEAKAIEENEKKKPIDKCGIILKCKCGAKVEIDIRFADGQLAEAQTQTAENYRKEKRKKTQSENYKDVQNQSNEVMGTSHSPMTKHDGSQVGDPDKAKKVSTDRGFECEIL